MKTGPQPDTQKSRLILKLEQMQAEQEDLMASYTTAFVQTSQSMLKDAQNTMKNDTAHFLFHNRRLFEQRIEQIRIWLRHSPWIVAGMVGAGIALMMVASWFWTVQLTRSKLTELGMTRVKQAGQTWMILDADRTELTTCTMGERAVYCIQIKEN